MSASGTKRKRKRKSNKVMKASETNANDTAHAPSDPAAVIATKSVEPAIVPKTPVDPKTLYRHIFFFSRAGYYPVVLRVIGYCGSKAVLTPCYGGMKNYVDESKIDLTIWAESLKCYPMHEVEEDTEDDVEMVRVYERPCAFGFKRQFKHDGQLFVESDYTDEHMSAKRLAALSDAVPMLDVPGSKTHMLALVASLLYDPVMVFPK